MVLSDVLAADESEPDVRDIDDFDPPGDDDDGDGDGGGGGDEEPIRRITVATFWAPGEAHFARLRLESHDIRCFMIDESVVAMQWLYANAVGGIKLQVPMEDAPRAGSCWAAASRAMTAHGLLAAHRVRLHGAPNHLTLSHDDGTNETIASDSGL